MSKQYGEVRSTNGWNWFGCLAAASFNGFRVLASLLHQRCSTEVNQTLHDVWPSPGLVHYIYIFGDSCPLTEFFWVQSSLSVEVLCSPILAALLHGTRAVGVSQSLRHGIQGTKLRNSRRGRHLYSAGRPSRWASAHILVIIRKLKTFLFESVFGHQGTYWFVLRCALGLAQYTRCVIITGTSRLLWYNFWINRYKLAIFIHKR